MKYRKYLILVLILLLSFSIIGCSNNPFSSDDESDEISELIIEGIEIGEPYREEETDKVEISVKLRGNAVDFKWTVDGDNGAGEIDGQGESSMVYTFPENPEGDYTVKVIVTDDSGEEHIEEKDFGAPTGLIVDQIEIEEDEIGLYDEITLSVEATDRGADSDAHLEYEWHKQELGSDEWELFGTSSSATTQVRSEAYIFRVKVIAGEQTVTRYREETVAGAVPHIESLRLDPTDEHIYYGLIDDEENRVTIEVTAVDPNPDADDEDLSYEWSVNRGRIEGDGASATYIPEGVSERDQIKVTVYVSNEQGRSDESVSFTLDPPKVNVEDILIRPENPTYMDTISLEVFFSGDESDLAWRLYDQDDSDYEKNLGEGRSRISWDPERPGNYRIEVDYPDEDDVIRTFEKPGIRVDGIDLGLPNEITVSGAINEDREIRIGETIDLYVDNIQEDPLGGEHTYHWELDGVGEINETTSDDMIEYEATETGAAIITFTVESEEGGEASLESSFVVISNDPEEPETTVTAENVEYGDYETGDELSDNITIYNDDTIKLSATAVHPDGLDLEYRWMRGHREIGRGETITYQPIDEERMPGDTHSIRLVVTDGQGGRAEKTAVSINLANREPVIDRIVGTGEITAGTERNFRVVAEDPDGGDLTERWKAEHGTIDNSGVYQAPSTAREDTITVTVIDSYGAEVEHSEEVTITEADLVITSINITDALVPIGEETRVNVSVDDPENSDLSYDWSVDGEGSISGDSNSVTYQAPNRIIGTITDTISVTVEDENDTSRYDTATIQVEVSNIWTETYQSGELQAGINHGWDYVLAGNSGDEWSRIEINSYGEEDESITGEGHSSANNVIYDLAEITGDGYLMVGQTDDSGYIKNTATEDRATPGDSLRGVAELVTGDYVVVGENDGSGYMEVRSSDLGRDWLASYGSQLNAVVEADDRIIAVGEIDAFNSSAYLVVVDRSGMLVEEKQYDDIAAFTDIQVTADGGYVMSSKDGKITRVDDNLNVDWSRSYGNSLNDVIESGTGYLAVGNNSTGAYAVKVDSNGHEEWSASFARANRFNGALRVNDGYILFGTDGSNQFVAKVDRNGNSSQ